MIFSVLISIIVAMSIIAILILARNIASKSQSGDVSKRVQKKGTSAILRDAEKKLSKDPHNISALKTLGSVYYGEKQWEKVWNIYKTLYDISAAHVEVDIADSTLKMGIAAYKMDKLNEAINSLMVSIKRDPNVFETNFYLGCALFKSNVFDKALFCLKKAHLIMPENLETNQFLGKCLFKLQKYRDSLPYLKKALDEDPEDKELLFDIAVGMTESGMSDKSLKIFLHLRPDPIYGPQSCLEAGKLHERAKAFESAIKDYEIGLKLQTIPEQILVQIKYRLACTYIAMNNLSKALEQLKQLQTIKPGYKDVESLLSRYGELNQNTNLQTYLMSGTSDFVALCRKIISVFHKGTFVKVEDVQVESECVQIICLVEFSKAESKQIFRFYRTQNTIGDIYIREFHGKIRDSKCDNGFCISIGKFSDSARAFIEGRPIDLIEKEQLVKLLKKING